MANYAKPSFPVEVVNRAGKSLVQFFTVADEEQPKNWTAATANPVEVIENWRAAHHYPLNSIHMTLRNRASHIHSSAITAQRIKRLESIAIKLIVEPTMKLSQMQDIGGCRAVLPTLDHVRRLRGLYNLRPLTHHFNGEKDYINEPKPTGYRGIHLKYRFAGKATSKPWDNLKIEIQLRTRTQHRWATAVEAAATFTKEALKSNRGRQEWLRFFALMGSVYALKEDSQTVPGTPNTLVELRREIESLNGDHHILSVFAQYRTIIPHIQKQSRARYFLVCLDPIKMEVSIDGFKAQQSQAANKAYIQAETERPKTTNVVLVSVNSITALKRAYPNYFLDTEDFLRDVAATLQP